jgi:hypothetical protein
MLDTEDGCLTCDAAEEQDDEEEVEGNDTE